MTVVLHSMHCRSDAVSQKKAQRKQDNKKATPKNYIVKMTPRIITYFLCGMRHPTTGLSEDDLSRLTGSSSSTSSAGNNSTSSCSENNTPAHKEGLNEGTILPHAPLSSDKHHNKSSHTHITANTRSTYLPEFINPLEWQKSRKRKERLDSTSSTTQDRKLQRSNSEKLLSQDNAPENVNDGKLGSDLIKAIKANEAIRRVSSEDFKKLPHEPLLKDNAEEKTLENDGSYANQQDAVPSFYREMWTAGPTKDRSRYETSPARSQRHSPIRGNGGSRLRDSDDSECEHERRRNSERFCKQRVSSGRKAGGVNKKSTSGSGRYLPAKRGDENVYKYDINALKNERRGFMSKKVPSTDKTDKSGSDHNDNNLIDFHQQKNMPAAVSPTPTDATPSTTNAAASTSNAPTKKQTSSNVPTTSAQEALPWVRTVPDDQAPVLSRRYASVRHHFSGNLDTAAKLSKVMPYPQHFKKQSSLLDDDLDCLETFRGFTTLEGLQAGELMSQVIPAMMSFQSPEERLKQINKRVTALKKKLAQQEEAWETRMGYRPSQAERLNDRYMKNILADLSKLRKERHELRSEPQAPVGLKVSGDMSEAQKLEKMKDTLNEIEQNLTDKRDDTHRSVVLEELTADQLVMEKTAVQHGLLYFESLYGRPSTKDERDAARPLYDRYRQLKRMVSRSVVLSGSAMGAPELPTILEHEAMSFEFTPQHYSSNNSTDTTNSPSDSVVPTAASSDDSTTTTTTTAAQAETETANTETNENISDLSIDQLWEQLDKTREEKRLLKRIIREFETVFEEQNGRKMLKSDRKTIEETYAQYKDKKAKTRLLQALVKKHISR